MNSSLLLRVQGDVKYTSNQQSPILKMPILKNLKIVVGDTNLKLEFSQVWVRCKFQLGDDITIYGIDGEAEDNNNLAYLVC
ncbi:MAG: hypothetical protein V7L01_29485 [Nostoc sp.]|uniref:hypothetical protein n=1 Tax=Nostoc sp. TaxID=1180 RepID=UPI002FF5DB33